MWPILPPILVKSTDAQLEQGTWEKPHARLPSNVKPVLWLHLTPCRDERAHRNGEARPLSFTAKQYLPSAFCSKHLQISINITTRTYEVQHSDPRGICRPSLFRLRSEQAAQEGVSHLRSDRATIKGRPARMTSLDLILVHCSYHAPLVSLTWGECVCVCMCVRPAASYSHLQSSVPPGSMKVITCRLTSKIHLKAQKSICKCTVKRKLRKGCLVKLSAQPWMLWQLITWKHALEYLLPPTPPTSLSTIFFLHLTVDRAKSKPQKPSAFSYRSNRKRHRNLCKWPRCRCC